jgi:cell division protein divIC, putative
MLLKCMKLSVRQGLKKMSRNIVQINNRFIQDENQRRRYLDEERRKRNRFMGWVLILVMLLFILPAYNLYQSYETLLNRRAQYAQLQKKYEKLGEEKSYQSDIATKLKDDSYAAKYARAKYSFSKEGEYIYTTPDLLPQ